MKTRGRSISQSWMRKVGAARSADLPAALRDLGVSLERDSCRGWRVPGYGGLIVWQRDDESWGWKQFSTDEGGDSISYLIHRNEMTHKEAVETLAPYGHFSPGESKSRSPRLRVALRKHTIPPKIWRDKASKLVEIARRELWADKDLAVWDWLRARGLRDDTIRIARLGWVHRDYYLGRKKWGLPTGRKGETKIFLPSGLLIPVGEVVRTSIRRFSDEGRRYHILSGSSPGPLVLGGTGKPVVVVETDLDALLIHQEAGESVTVASMGSAGGKPDARLAAYLLVAPRILVSLDADQAGRRASRWWLDRFPQAKLWPTPWSKDPGDAFGGTPGLVRSWIQAGLG